MLILRETMVMNYTSTGVILRILWRAKSIKSRSLEPYKYHIENQRLSWFNKTHLKSNTIWLFSVDMIHCFNLVRF